MKNKPHESPSCRCAACGTWLSQKSEGFTCTFRGYPIDLVLWLMGIEPDSGVGKLFKPPASP